MLCFMLPAIEESAELLAVLAGLLLVLWLLARQRPSWAAAARRHRVAIVVVLAAVVVLVEVTETVIGHESTALDRALLAAIHNQVPADASSLFAAATATGSFYFLIPAVALVALGLVLRRRGLDGAQLALTLAAAGAVVYLSKAAVNRDRPALWDTAWYWGSSFPSGHTLATAAVASAGCLIAARWRPATAYSFAILGTAWVMTVAASRLVLGVHWPTDVVAAACAGLLTAVGVDAALRAYRRTRTP